jgi:C-terminal processing protease CtpA/Prc
MLSSETFNLDNDYKITLPTADYYASDGYKIDGNGVEPSIKTNSQDALQKAIEIKTSLENN